MDSAGGFKYFLTLFTFIGFSEAEVVVVGQTALVENGNYNFFFSI